MLPSQLATAAGAFGAVIVGQIMTALHRVIVIVEQGRIVGTQIAAVEPLRDIGAASARLRLGPGQAKHELQAAVPSDFSKPGDRERFHASLLEQIAGKK